MVRPNGGELWEIGTQQEIAWTSQSVTGNVRIELSRDDGATWTSLTDDALNSGSLTWQVFGPASNRCLVRVRAGALSDVSDGLFEIASPPQPQLTLTAPNGGETLTDTLAITEPPAHLLLSAKGHPIPALDDLGAKVRNQHVQDGLF